MRKKLKLFLVSFILIFSCFSFAGCSYGGLFDKPGTSTPSPPYKPPPGSNIPVPPPTDSTVNPFPVTGNEDGTMEDLFHGFTYLSEENSEFLTNDSSALDKKEFRTLVDRQINVFAQDLAIRLCAVYGAGLPTTSEYTENSSTNSVTIKEFATNKEDLEYGDVYSAPENIFPAGVTEGINEAKVNSRYIMEDVVKIDNSNNGLTYKHLGKEGDYCINHGRLDPNLDCIGCFAELINSGRYKDNNELLLYANFKPKYSILGGYIWNNAITDEQGNVKNGYFSDGVDVDYDGNTSSVVFNSSEAWNVSLNSMYPINGKSPAENALEFYYDFYLSVQESIKLNVARILATGDYLNTDLTYSEALNNITHLGFLAVENDEESEQRVQDEQVVIENFVLNEIVGKNLVELDNARKPSNTTISYGVSLSDDNHRYKAYGLLIPAICKQTFNHAFNTSLKDFVFPENDLSGIPPIEGEVNPRIGVFPTSARVSLSQGDFSSLNKGDASAVAEELDDDLDEDLEEETDVPEPAFTNFNNFKSIVLKPKKGAYVLSAMFALHGDAKYNLTLQFTFKYVVNGEVLFNGTCKNIVGGNEDGTINVGKGNYDSDINDNSYEFDIYNAIGVSEEEYLEKFKFGEFNGIKNEEETIWQNSLIVEPVVNGISVVGNNVSLKAGDNYFEINISVVNIIDNNGEEVLNYNPKFAVGFLEFIG